MVSREDYIGQHILCISSWLVLETERKLGPNLSGTEQPFSRTVRPSKVEIMRTHQESVDSCLKALDECTFQSLDFLSSEEENCFFISWLSSYIADIPECQHIISVTHGQKTSSACLNCLISQSYFTGIRIAENSHFWIFMRSSSKRKWLRGNTSTERCAPNFTCTTQILFCADPQLS